jgi:hypothetical protein
VSIIGLQAFSWCTNLMSVTIGTSVTSIGDYAFAYTGLTNVVVPNSVTNVGGGAFWCCSSLRCVTIAREVTTIGDWAFYSCTRLTQVFCMGNAPSLGGPHVFEYDNNATVYFLPGTTGWGVSFGGRPTSVWVVPRAQTAEVGSAVEFRVRATVTGELVPAYQWFFNDANRLSCTNSVLQIANVQFWDSGAYTAVVTIPTGSVTSSPAILNVVSPVERRLVPALTLVGQPGSSLTLDFAEALAPTPQWTTLDNVVLSPGAQWYFDISAPLASQRFYRVWQTGAPSMAPSLDLQMVPAVTLTGATGGSVRLDYINQFGPINAWVTLDTVTLTNASQLYFDVTAPGRPPRLYRLVQVP